MKRIATTSVIMALAVCAFALSSFVSVFKTTYKLADDSDLAKAKCQICHVGKAGGKLNLYGKDVFGALRKANTKKLTSEILHSIDGMDSDKDGVKNGDQIKAGRLPGGSAASN